MITKSLVFAPPINRFSQICVILTQLNIQWNMLWNYKFYKNDDSIYFLLYSEFHASNFMLQALISNCRNLEALNGFTKVGCSNVFLVIKGVLKRINTFKDLFWKYFTCKLFNLICFDKVIKELIFLSRLWRWSLAE